MPRLFIIAGCNGAGKTTASFTFLPELLQVREFVNADEIARGLSPFQPENAAIEAGRIMLRRMDELLTQNVDFAFETTLATRSFRVFIREAKGKGYTINLIYYWLNSVELASERVRLRVAAGGHTIPEAVIHRRYFAGLRNFVNLYRQEVDDWLLIDNSGTFPEIIAESKSSDLPALINKEKWETILAMAHN